MSPQKMVRYGHRLIVFAALGLLAVAVPACHSTKPSEAVVVTIAPKAAPRVEFGAERLVEALSKVGVKAAIVRGTTSGGPARRINIGVDESLPKEGFSVATGSAGAITISGGDASGTLYGCLELARLIRDVGRMPERLQLSGSVLLRLV